MRTMKNAITVFLFTVMATIHTAAQDVSEKDVSVERMKSFKAKYPGQYVHEWERQKKSGV